MSRPALVPELMVTNITRSLQFYVEQLGFAVEFDRPEEGFAWVSFEGVHIMLDQTGSLEAVTDQEFIEQRQWRTGKFEYPLGRGINLEMAVSDSQGIYDSLISQRYPIKVPIEERWYRIGDELQGVRQFLVMDPDGYLLRFSTSLGRKPNN